VRTGLFSARLLRRGPVSLAWTAPCPSRAKRLRRRCPRGHAGRGVGEGIQDLLPGRQGVVEERGALRARVHLDVHLEDGRHAIGLLFDRVPECIALAVDARDGGAFVGYLVATVANDQLRFVVDEGRDSGAARGTADTADLVRAAGRSNVALLAKTLAYCAVFTGEVIGDLGIYGHGYVPASSIEWMMRIIFVHDRGCLPITLHNVGRSTSSC